MRIAVIDLGTNTCNLLIADTDSGNYTILHQSKELVKLGDNKIKGNKISNEATARTLQAFQSHQKLIQKFKVEKVKVIATSAVRKAENRIEFLEKISDTTGWVIKVISGEKEAELIFKGVLLAFGEFKKPVLILDIGGGSNELILAEKKEILWKESRPSGMARVITRFKISDPVLPEEIKTLQNYFAGEHTNSFNKSKATQTEILIGCAGAFDTLADIIDGVNPGEKKRTKQTIPTKQFYEVYNQLIHSTRQQRLKIKGMDLVRVDLIVPAVIFIECVISKVGIKEIIQTDFSLREGVLSDFE